MTIKELKILIMSCSDELIVHFRCDCPYEEEEMDEIFPNWRNEKIITLGHILKD